MLDRKATVNAHKLGKGVDIRYFTNRQGISLVVHWLRLRASTAGAQFQCLLRGHQAARHSQRNK